MTVQFFKANPEPSPDTAVSRAFSLSEKIYCPHTHAYGYCLDE